ncbi:MAG TPA: flagellar biosynthesis anti-sigma factor FlgM [Xanthomonadaceae bacterium]|jgi:negative regulator of flagellin synthesis FlgM|nr:flagellar biosynthesis anti-sigma factor FlgM [Xanthomonadaceae bacterium]
MTSKIDGAPAPRPAATPVASAPVPAAIERSGSPRAQAIAEVQAASADNVRLTGEAEALRVVQQQAKAGPPPLDMAKIDALRAALAAGTYRVDPMDIARRLDALERELSI